MLHLVEVNVHRGLQRRTKLACRTQLLEFARNIGLERDHGIPVDLLRRLHFRQGPPRREQHGFVARAGQVFPDLLGRERQDRRQPAHHGLGDVVHRGLRGSARGARGRHRVEAVFQDVEPEGAQLDDAEAVHFLVNHVEVVVAVGLDDLRLQRARAGECPAVDLQQALDGQRIARRVETRQIAEQESQGVAHAAVAIRHALEDLVGDTHLRAVVSRCDPKPQHIGTEGVHDLLRRHHIAERLRHLAALVVHGESVRDDLAVGRNAAARNRSEQRAVEPAAMLIGAFEVEIHRKWNHIRAQRGQAVMDDARVEPHVHDVVAFFVDERLVAEQLARIQREPGLDAALFNQLRDPLQQFRGLRMRLARLLVHEHRKRHAPGTLARDAPVRASLDHAGDALLAPVWQPAHLADSCERIAPQPCFFHAQEPLRRRTEDHRRLMAPAMRIAVHIGFVMDQPACVSQRVDDRCIGIEHRLSFEQRRAGHESSVGSDRIVDRQAVLAAHLVIVGAVARGRVHGSGAGLERHVSAQDHGYFAFVERMLQPQALERCALGCREHAARGRADASCDRGGQSLGNDHPLDA